MLPNIGDAKVDKLLSQFSQKYTNDSYISELILPAMKVKEKTGKFAKYGTENLRVYSDQIVRAPGTRANSVDYSVSQGSYVCQERSLEKRVPDEYINNTDDPYDPKRDAVATLMDNLWINQEKALQTVMADNAILTNNTTLAGISQWSDYDNSSPLSDIETGITAIQALTGKRPNTATMGLDVMMKLKYHPEIREQVRYTGNAKLSDADLGSFLKEFFNLEKVFVGTAVYDKADEGQAASLASIWTKDFWLMHQATRPSLMGSAFGYTFTDTPRKVETYREESHVSDVVRVRSSYDQNLMDVNLAYLIENAIA
jgi:hypothetical protein